MKKKHRNRNEACKAQEGYTLASKVNTVESGEPSKKKNKNQKCLDWDLSTVLYYNYNKKNHYANTCPNPLKN